MKTVADIMTSMPIVATVPGSRNDAINLMVRNKLTGVPVVRESDGQLMGIVSRRDVFKNMNEEQLSMLMKKNPITISPDKTIAEAAKIFYDLRIHRLPVVDTCRVLCYPRIWLCDVDTEQHHRAEHLVAGYAEFPYSVGGEKAHNKKNNVGVGREFPFYFSNLFVHGHILVLA